MSQLLMSLKASGALRAKGKWTPKPLSPADKFVAAAKEQMKQLEGGSKSGKWFQAQADGSFKIWPHAGTAILTFEGEKIEVVAEDRKKAVEYMNQFIAAAASGELDKELNDAAAKLKAKRALN